jgi:hypothetical protein
MPDTSARHVITIRMRLFLAAPIIAGRSSAATPFDGTLR